MNSIKPESTFHYISEAEQTAVNLVNLSGAYVVDVDISSEVSVPPLGA